MTIFALLCCCSLALALESNHCSTPIVESPMGLYKGLIIKSRLGKDIYSFRGIRYGEAATREKRFKQATPAAAHSDVFDATQDGPSCPQPITDNRVISEDCLRLNVYTKALPESSSGDQKGVLFFIHPGAFYSSSGSSEDWGPQYLLDRDIVLVTINYRLGSLGFMSIDDDRAPGNAGLTDQVLALRWVKQNIHAFGGNPNSVTLWGYGAGAFSVTLHMVSPMSTGLFHRAIACSGAATSQTILPVSQKKLARKQGESLGCPTNNIDDMLSCMYEKPMEEYAKFVPQFTEFQSESVIVWSPVVEKPRTHHCNYESFLPAQPIDLIREKKANFVPLIIGVNRDESSGAIIHAVEQAQKGNTTIFDDFNNNWEEVAPIVFAYERDTPRSQEISRELKSFYLNDEPITLTNYQGLARLYTDALTIFQAYRFERLMAEYSPHEVYNYIHKYKACESFTKWSNGSNYGVGHYDDLMLIFKFRHFPTICQKDVKMVKSLTDTLEHFTKTNKPFPANKREDFNVDWQPSTTSEPQYLQTGTKFTTRQGSIYQDRMRKFEELFPLPSKCSTDGSTMGLLETIISVILPKGS